VAEFPFAKCTPNQLSWQERDERYARLHKWPQPVYRHKSGLLMLWKYADVREVLEADTPGTSNANSLDPLVGFPRIIATPGAIPHFLRHLVPLPAKTTANLTDPELHKRVWMRWPDRPGISRSRRTSDPNAPRPSIRTSTRRRPTSPQTMEWM
jgi:hypothetical protein